MDELTREFLIESQEGLDRMERCLTELEKKPGDAGLVADIFRSVHTIKGTTGFLGYKRLEKLAHAGENLLGLLREGKLAAGAGLITALLQLLDSLRSILRSIETDDSEGAGDDAALIQRLEELQCETASAVTTRDSARTLPAKSRRRSVRTGTSEAGKASTRDALAAKSTPATLPSMVATCAAGETEVAGSPEEDRGAQVGTQGLAAAETTLRVDVTLLNRMMNLVGELVLTRNQVLQATAAVPSLTLLSRRLDMVTADLRESVMKARMQPVSNVFAKMPRLVRDLCNSLGRRVRLEMEGQETELDKSLLEAIKDPLTHAVRNALDHGIELPETRIAAGKNAEGLLRLRAVQEGSHVIIEVADDGAGIPVDRVRERAIERNLITAEEARQQSERELLQLIFVPGFSTASAVTKVSGRGVGMDVVRTNVEKIGGKVELDSRAGKGTTLRLRIPLTLAIIPALIVRSTDQNFALPQAALSELVHVSRERSGPAIEWIEDAPLYRLRGSLLPLVFLDRLLAPGVRDREKSTEGYIAVLEADGRRYGLVVDGLHDPEEIVVKPLNPSLKGIGLYSGATVLGSGNLALILDPAAIAARAGIEMAEDREDVGNGDAAAAISDSAEYLLVEISGQRAAVPLGDVLRIEQIPISRIEYVAGRPALNFNGELLTVDDSGNLLSATNEDGQVVIVVCKDGTRHVGFVVAHVLDVAHGTELVEAGSRRRTEGVTQLKERVTGLVNLAGISPLVQGETSQGWCAEVAQ